MAARSVHRRIATSSYHTCVIMGAEATGPVKCWGMNWNGQLSYGDTVSRGGSSSDMGGNLGFVDLGTGRTAKSLALGYHISCALLDNDKVSPRSLFLHRAPGVCPVTACLPAVSILAQFCIIASYWTGAKTEA